MTPTWVLGRGGLLGRHVAAALGPAVWSRPAPEREPLAWEEPERLAAQVEAGARRLLADAAGGPWRLAWCAGRGVIGVPEEALALEARAFEAALAGLGRALDATPGAGPGAMFLASSAGGVWAGSGALARPPFDEATPPAPLSPYGRTKLAQEAAATAWSERRGVPLLVGRLSNLYGPGQDLEKPQGLISQACRAVLRREALTIWVPLDTVRDYVLARDAAAAIVRCLDRLEQERPARPVVRIVASEVPTTVAAVLQTFRHLLRRAPRLRAVTRAATGQQPRVLTFRARVWPELTRPATPLHLGVAEVVRDLHARLLAGTLR